MRAVHNLAVVCLLLLINRPFIHELAERLEQLLMLLQLVGKRERLRLFGEAIDEETLLFL